MPDYIEYLTTSGLFNALHEPGHSDNLLSKVEKLYLGKDDLEFAAGNSIPIWLFGFIY